MLRAERITIRYGQKTVVEQASLALDAGQWLMLCGPNGAGKSTLVRAIGQSVPYQGRVLIEGRDARALRPHQLARTVGILPQNSSVSYAFTVEEIVSMGRYAHRHGVFARVDAQGTAAVEGALDMTGLQALRGQNVLTLSGGELQRVFLAQVFAQQPRILILDEPANHLDLQYQQQVFGMIGTWLRQPGHAVLSVVHDLSLARRFGTHAVLMQDGRVAAAGEIDRVLLPERLRDIYHMDVYAWMRQLYQPWQEDAPQAAK